MCGILTSKRKKVYLKESSLMFLRSLVRRSMSMSTWWSLCCWYEFISRGTEVKYKLEWVQERMRRLESFSNFYKASVQFSSVTQSCLKFGTPWTAAFQASLSITNSWSSPKLMSIELVMPSNHLILVSTSPPALSLSQHQGLFHWVSSSHQVP